MAAKSFKHSLFSGDKPHSSITDWVEILTAHTTAEEAYDGIPELVDSISLQPTGPAEASRALRKKLKHGDSHRQYRALVLLKALVDNGGPKFQTSFADNQLTDAIRQLAADPSLDHKVRRKLTAVLASWYREFKDEPSMSIVANLYRTTRDHTGYTLYENSDAVRAQQAAQREREAQKERDRIEAKQRAKLEKEEMKRKKAAAKYQDHNKPKRKTFNFQEEKPKVLSTIVEASQYSNNLVNALQLVNRDKESVQDNARVQECLAQVKHVRKYLIRYVQLVEDEQFIGTLIDANERVIAALETYDNYCGAERVAGDKETAVEGTMQSMSLNDSTELGKLQSKQRERVARSINRSKESVPSSDLHPNLEDLSFGKLGSSNQELPPPMRPSIPDSPTDESYGRGSLSDYSDYDSDDEPHASTSVNRTNHLQDDSDDDPFADPFVDQDEVSTPGISERKVMQWA